MSDRPERACVLLAKITADDRHSMASHLFNLAHQVERGEIGFTSVSGGFDSGHILTYSESASPSHDEYFAQLNAHLEARRAEKETPALSEQICFIVYAPTRRCTKPKGHEGECGPV